MTWAGALAVLAALAAGAACEGARNAAHLSAEIERRHPGSRIAVEETLEDGTRTVQVSIRARELPSDMAALGDEAREIARLARDRFALRGTGDRIVVVLRAEERAGALRSRQRARFVFAAAKLGSG